MPKNENLFSVAVCIQCALVSSKSRDVVILTGMSQKEEEEEEMPRVREGLTFMSLLFSFLQPPLPKRMYAYHSVVEGNRICFL